MRIHSLALLASIGTLAATAPAQLTPAQIHAAGLGAQKMTIDAEGATKNNGLLGVVYLNGNYYVTGRRLATTEPHKVYVFDGTGKLTGDFDQLANTSSSAWGWRDGATDGQSLIFGYEDGINVVDPTGKQVDTIIAYNGPQKITQPIKAEKDVTTHRAVAYNPMGNGGDGSIWLGNFSSRLVEIALDGKVLTSHPLNGSWSLYGLAWDPFTNTLLGNSIPNAGDIGQIDPVSGKVTGIGFPRNQPGTAQGGLSAVWDPDHDGPGGGGWDVVGLDQGTPDAITRYRVHMYTQPVRSGYDEARLITGVGSGELDGDPIKTVVPEGTFSFQLTGDFLKNPAWALVNARADALKNGVTYFGSSHNIFPELVALHPGSDPIGAAVLVQAFGGAKVTLGVPDFLKDGDYLRVQAVTINPGGIRATTATNQMFFQYDGARVVVEAVGSNSFNSVRDSGFFRVIHNAGSPIAKVVFDWKDSSNTSQATMRFDTNQTGMNDRFDGGNSKLSTCEGTYRNGCDVTTGLVYTGTPPAGCDPTANTGWVGTNQYSTISGDWQTLTFEFAGGKFKGTVFEFDADTDGGQGITGADMEGMVVIVTLDDNTVLKGELKVDPNTTQRSFIRFL